MFSLTAWQENKLTEIKKKKKTADFLYIKSPQKYIC